MAPINPKITIRPIYFGMLLLSAAVMISAVRLTSASELDSLKTAAEQGDVRAQVTLGLMYNYGFGVPKDYVQAYALVMPAVVISLVMISNNSLLSSLPVCATPMFIQA